MKALNSVTLSSSINSLYHLSKSLSGWLRFSKPQAGGFESLNHRPAPLLLYSLALLLSVLPIISFAQKLNYSVGIEAGINSAFMKGVPYDETFPSEQLRRQGQIGGLFGQVHFGKFLSVKTGFYYEHKGMVIKALPSDFERPDNMPFMPRYEYDHLIDTRVVPLLFRFDYGRKLKAFANAGGYAAYIRRTEYRVTDPLYYYIDVAGSRYFKSYEFGLSGGLGLAYTLKDKVSFSFEVRSNYGLSDIRKEKYTPAPYRLTTLNFLLGVTHHLTSNR